VKSLSASLLAVFLLSITAPAQLIGFKRGENAVLPQGKRFVVFVQTDTTVKLPVERSGQ